MAKVYVDMTIHIDSLGKKTPLVVEWKDGRRYKVDRVLQVQRVYATGGQCLQYRVQIGKKTRLLFCELDTALARWFVETMERGQGHCCRDIAGEPK